MELQVEPFSQDRLPQVQGFECGTEDPAVWATEWIKSPLPFPGALKSMQDHGTSVWLYLLSVPALEEQPYLVGFGSLGTTRWVIDPPDGPKREAGFIPMLAVASAFQRKPAREKRYSEIILEDLIDKARGRNYRELCLFVHKDNGRAIRLYERYSFRPLGGPDGRGNLRMLRLLD